MYFRGFAGEIYGTECDFGSISVNLVDELSGLKRRVPYRELEVSLDGGKTWLRYGLIVKKMSEE